MTEEIIKVLLKNRGVDKDGSSLINAEYNDLQVLAKDIEIAISDTRCCDKLKDKEVLTFEEWIKSEGYTKIKDKDEYRKGMIRSDEFNLRHSYTKYLNL